MKLAGQKVLDTVLMSRKCHKTIPEDVLRRQRILEEHLLTNKGARRLSVKAFAPPTGKARRMSSRELMKHAGPEIEMTVVHDTEQKVNCFVNPMKRNGGGATSLEEKVDQLMRDNVSLKTDIVELKTDNVGLKKDNVELKREVASLRAGQTTPSAKKSEERAKDSKTRTKRLSRVMKARRYSAQNVNVQGVEDAVEDAVEEDEIHVDPESGRRYSVSAVTGESAWIDEEED